MKLATPSDQLVAAGMALVTDAPAFWPKFIGLSELAGVVGLILSAVTRIQQKLTPIAAALLAFVMLLAMPSHSLSGDSGGTMPSVKAPIAAR